MDIAKVFCVGHEWEKIKSLSVIKEVIKSIKLEYNNDTLYRRFNNDRSEYFKYDEYKIAHIDGGIIFFRNSSVNPLIWIEEAKIDRGVQALREEIVFLILHVSRRESIREISDQFEKGLNLSSRYGFDFPFIVILPIINTVSVSAIAVQMSNIVEIKINESRSLYQDVISRSIEFTPEYYSAGLGILNYFGTYLREQYSEENATVRIEQDGLIVRLIVSTLDGRSEIVEKALQEYQLIITGNEAPESIVNNHSLVLELKNELRMAVARVEMQKDIMSYQQADIKELREILKTSLSQNHTIVINANPTATATADAKNEVNLTVNFSQALQDIANLKSELQSGTEAHKELQEVEKAVEAIKNETDPKVVKHSTAMQKLGDFITKFGEGTDKVEKALTIGKKAWDIFKQLAATYNSIAQSCGYHHF